MIKGVFFMVISRLRVLLPPASGMSERVIEVEEAIREAGGDRMC